jgi:hypothetical protein
MKKRSVGPKVTVANDGRIDERASVRASPRTGQCQGCSQMGVSEMTEAAEAGLTAKRIGGRSGLNRSWLSQQCQLKQRLARCR